MADRESKITYPQAIAKMVARAESVAESQNSRAGRYGCEGRISIKRGFAELNELEADVSIAIQKRRTWNTKCPYRVEENTN